MGTSNPGRYTSASPIRTVSSVFLPSTLTNLGLDYSDFLRSADIHPEMLEGSEMPFEYPRLANLLQKAAEFADCEHLGIVLGQFGGMTSLGALGQAISEAPTVRAALSGIDAEFHSQDRGAIVEFKWDDFACLSYIIVDPTIDSGAVISDAAMAIAMRLLTELCGPGWAPELVELSRRLPRDCRPYRRLFKCPVAFNATVAAIHFKGTWLDKPVAARPQGSAAPESLPHEIGTPELTERVVLQLARSISAGATISASKVARIFGMCGRTLQRELTKAQTSYRCLSDDVRFGVTKRLLFDTDISVTEIALVLGYADVSVLTRAFTRWAGICPSEWRSRNRPYFPRQPTAEGSSVSEHVKRPATRLLPLSVSGSL
jgi:AraC-like DNA-binding protein